MDSSLYRQARYRNIERDLFWFLLGAWAMLFLQVLL